jgi:lantibiotic modifying enzyme
MNLRQKRRIESYISSLADACVSDNPSLHTPHISLVSGETGLILWYAYLYAYFGKEHYFKKFSELLDQSIALLATQPADATIANGFTGLLWVIKHVIKLDLLDRQADEDLADLNSHMKTSFEADIDRKDYDLLHGLIGKGVYFLESLPDPASATALTRIVDILENLAVAEAGGITWRDYIGAAYRNDANNNSVPNLGMAHGVPSVISFLSKVYQHRIATGKVKKLLEQAVHWLLRQENPTGHSCFSNRAYDTHESRLAWCYGDLGPALALFHAAQTLSRLDWREKAISIALYAAKRTQENARIVQSIPLPIIDTGFCHGTAGVLHSFHRFYQATRHTEFRLSVEYWLTITLQSRLEMAKGKFSYLYPKYSEDEKKHIWLENPYLLEGGAGVGLVLLSLLYSPPAAWDSLFMTDIHTYTNVE